MTTPLPEWALYVQAFLGPGATVVAAGVAAFVTYNIQSRHLRATQEKFRLDLFERRLSCFIELKSLIEQILCSNIPSSAYNDLYNSLIILSRNAQFLFDENVNEAIRIIIETMKNLEFNLVVDRENVDALERTKIVNDIIKNRESLRHSFVNIDNIFMPYLNFKNLRVG